MRLDVSLPSKFNKFGRVSGGGHMADCSVAPILGEVFVELHPTPSHRGRENSRCDDDHRALHAHSDRSCKTGALEKLGNAGQDFQATKSGSGTEVGTNNMRAVK